MAVTAAAAHLPRQPQAWLIFNVGQIMKKVLLAAVVVGLIVCLTVLASREKKKATITDFSWSVVGKTAPYAFHIANRTNDPQTVVICLEAQNVHESKVGTQLGTLGRATVEVRLASREEKKIEGAIDLISFGNSNTVVSYYAAINPPNKAPEPTTVSVTHPADAGCAPATVAAHL